MRKRLLAGHPPTVREVQQKFQMRAVQSAKSHLDKLVQEGRLIKEPGKARGYRLPEKTQNTTLIPVVGSVPAGPFNIAVEDIDGYIPIQSSAEEDAFFALRVNGDSMIEAGIFDNDIVVVRRHSEIHQGDIVVAMIDGEATVKEYRRVDGYLQLLPRNKDYPVISIMNPQSLTVLGKVIEVRRFLEGANLISEGIYV